MFVPVPDQEAALFISYVFADGGNVSSRTVEYDTNNHEPFPPNVLGFPRMDEIFTIEGIARPRLQTGDIIQLRANDGHFVGIDHDEEDHTDSVVENDTEAGPGDSFAVTVVQDANVVEQLSALNGLDPYGPPQPVRLVGNNNNFLAFPAEGDGFLDISGDAAGHRQTFAIDFLPDGRKVRRPHL
jgi:hypothetical protein